MKRVAGPHNSSFPKPHILNRLREAVRSHPDLNQRPAARLVAERRRLSLSKIRY